MNLKEKYEEFLEIGYIVSITLCVVLIIGFFTLLVLKEGI